MVKTTPFNIFGHPNLTFSLLKAIPEPKRCPLLLKVPIVAKKVPIVGLAGFSKSNSVFNPSHAFWLTASIQILPREANFLRRQFAKRTAFFKKRENKIKLLNKAKPPVSSTPNTPRVDTEEGKVTW